MKGSPKYAIAIVTIFLVAKAVAIDLLSTDFSTNPVAGGWSAVGQGSWANGQIVATGTSASWLSPSFAVAPDAYYRIEYSSRTATDAILGTLAVNTAATFNLEPVAGNPLYFREGQLLFDNYTGIPKSTAFATRTSYVRAPGGAAGMFLRFIGTAGGLAVTSMKVSTATAEEARVWAEGIRSGALLGTLPPAAPPADRVTRLPATLAKLRAGGEVRLAMTGDSTVTDTMNSYFPLFLRASYPLASIRFLEATGHGTGMGAWNDPDPSAWREAGLEFDEAVIATSPDLVVLGGISNTGSGNLAATGELIDRIRAGSGTPPEILLMTGAAYAGHDSAYATALGNLAATKGVAFYDFSAAWHAYLQALATAGVTTESLKRDSIHSNDSGKQVLGRVMERYFFTGAPVITLPPAPVTVILGEVAAFSVSAVGTPAPSYQWLRNGVAIQGGTTASYQTLPTSAEDHGALFSVRVTNSAGTSLSAAVPLSVRASFAAWQAGHFSPAELANPAVSGANAIPRGDGMPNLFKYAFALDPAVPAARGATVLGKTEISGAVHLTMSYRERRIPTDLVYLPEVAGGLSGWVSGDGRTAVVGRVDNGDGTDTVVVRDLTPLSAAASRFMRLTVRWSGAP